MKKSSAQGRGERDARRILRCVVDVCRVDGGHDDPPLNNQFRIAETLFLWVKLSMRAGGVLGKGFSTKDSFLAPEHRTIQRPWVRHTVACTSNRWEFSPLTQPDWPILLQPAR